MVTKKKSQSIEEIRKEKEVLLKKLSELESKEEEYNSPKLIHERLTIKIRKPVMELIDIFSKEGLKHNLSKRNGKFYQFTFEIKDSKGNNNSTSGKPLNGSVVVATIGKGKAIMKSELKKLFPNYDVETFCRNFTGKISGGGGKGVRKKYHVS